MQFAEWEAKYEAWQEAKEKQAKWSRNLRRLQQEREEQQRDAEQWRSQLEHAREDVDKLEGLSWSRLFYTFLGKKDDLLDERQKAVVEAKLKYDEAMETTADIDNEIADLKRKLIGIGNPDAEYRQLLAAKEQLIHDHRSGLSEELYELLEQKQTIKAYTKELKEAIHAGEQVIHALDRAENSLRSAGNWGIYDMMGGGIIATAVKHSRIDDGRSHIHEAQRRMRQFEKELKDVQAHIQVELETGGLVKFADFFFDSLIVDWVVQGRIRQSEEQVKSQRNKIGSLLSRLRSEYQQWERKLFGLQQEYKRRVLEAT